MADEARQASGLVGKRIGRVLVASARPVDPPREVYDGEIVDGGGRVTVFVIRADEPRVPELLRRAEKLRAIKHAGLVDVIEVGKLDGGGGLFVTMEQPLGKTVRELAGGKPMDQRRALLIVRQVLEALEAAHAANEIHGNVNPNAIVILPGLGDDRVKLGELGIAALGGAKHAADPTYAAVGPINDARADLYAAGAVLYELVCGRPPFVGNDREALQRLHSYAPVQKLAQRAPEGSYSEALETVVATALAKKRDVRYRTARDMITALDLALAAVPAPAPARTLDAEPVEDAPTVAHEPDESLLLMMQELKQKPPPPPPRAAVDEVPVFSDNAAREVPTVPWHVRARGAANRTLDRASTALRVPRWAAGALAGAIGFLLLVAIVKCGGSSEPTKKQQVAARPTPDEPTRDEPMPTPDAAADEGTPPSSTPPEFLEARCEQLATACADTPKRKTAMLDECKKAAKQQQKCVDAAITVYDCYEANLCGKADKVWAFGDLVVLARRHKKCEDEGATLRKCVGE